MSDYTDESEEKYNKEELRAALKRYFDSISKPETVREKFDTGEQTAKGEPVFAMRDVLGEDGDPIKVRRWYSPPSTSGLCLFLGLSREELAGMSSDVRYADVFEYAELMFDVYAEQLLHEGRQTQSMLERLRGGSRRTEKTQSYSLEEREKLIREAFAALGGT